jgi:hypothetical protein
MLLTGEINAIIERMYASIPQYLVAVSYHDFLMYTVPYYARKLGLKYKDIIETNCNITSEFLCVTLTSMKPRYEYVDNVTNNGIYRILIADANGDNKFHGHSFVVLLDGDTVIIADSYGGKRRMSHKVITRKEFDTLMENVHLFTAEQSASLWERITDHQDYGVNEEIEVEIVIERWGNIPQEPILLCESNIKEIHDKARHESETDWCDSWDIVNDVYGN